MRMFGPIAALGAGSICCTYIILLHAGRSPYPTEVLDPDLHASKPHGSHSLEFVGFWLKDNDTKHPLLVIHRDGSYKAGSLPGYWHESQSKLNLDWYSTCGTGAPEGCYVDVYDAKWADNDTLVLSSDRTHGRKGTYRRIDPHASAFRQQVLEEYASEDEDVSYRAYWIIDAMSVQGLWDRDDTLAKATALYERSQRDEE